MQQIKSDEIHIHQLLISDEIDSQMFMNLLSSDELVKAARFNDESKRRIYIIVRGTLRQKLAEYLGTNPQEIEFAYSETGKPFLKTDPEFTFNLSHSANLAVFAFARNAMLGIDVEKIRYDFNFERIINRFFSTAQIREIRESKNPSEIFFQLWTRKEAYIKAVGSTVFGDLKTLDVSSDCLTFSDKKSKFSLKIKNLELPENFVASLAYSYETAIGEKLIIL